jgi:hypothetical protein
VNGSSNQNSQDQTSTTPPPMRYLPRSSHPFMPYPPTTQSPQSSSSQQRHSLSPGGQYGTSPAMMMPSPNTNGHISAHDFNMPMGYHSPVTTSPGTFGGLSSNSPQSSHSQQHHHHILPPVTQGWGDFGYASYPTGPISDHHDQHDHGSSSP